MHLNERNQTGSSPYHSLDSKIISLLRFLSLFHWIGFQDTDSKNMVCVRVTRLFWRERWLSLNLKTQHLADRLVNVCVDLWSVGSNESASQPACWDVCCRLLWWKPCLNTETEGIINSAVFCFRHFSDTWIKMLLASDPEQLLGFWAVYACFALERESSIAHCKHWLWLAE